MKPTSKSHRLESFRIFQRFRLIHLSAAGIWPHDTRKKSVDREGNPTIPTEYRQSFSALRHARIGGMEWVPQVSGVPKQPLSSSIVNTGAHRQGAKTEQSIYDANTKLPFAEGLSVPFSLGLDARWRAPVTMGGTMGGTRGIQACRGPRVLYEASRQGFPLTDRMRRMLVTHDKP